MYYKEESEKDPSRCRELRDIERGIEAQRDSTNNEFNSAKSELKKLRDERARFGEREKNLKIMIAGATVMSGGRGAIGHVLGGTSSSLATQLAVLQAQIESIKGKISEFESRISVLGENRKLLNRSLAENAAAMRQLNCVR